MIVTIKHAQKSLFVELLPSLLVLSDHFDCKSTSATSVERIDFVMVSAILDTKMNTKERFLSAPQHLFIQFAAYAVTL